jgi:glutaredoxin 3
MTASQKIQVYTMQYCPYCLRAKNLLTQRGIPFHEILVSTDDDAQWDALYKRSGMRTMPQIFAGDRLIGGYTELAELEKQDQLQSLK